MEVTTEDLFIAQFGTSNAMAVLAAANAHANESGNEALYQPDNEDTFATAILICISWECFTRFASKHRITADSEKVREWVKKNGIVGGYMGPVPDFLGLLAGAYDSWM